MGRKKPTARDEETAPAGGGGGGKSKKKGFVIADDEYSIGTELSEDAVVPEEKVAPVEDEEEDDNDRKDNDEDDEEQEVPVAFSGKKKPSKSKKSGSTFSSAFELLDGEEESKDKDESSKEEEEDLGIAFTGKKKKKSSKGLKKASGNSFGAALLDEENDEDASVSKVGDDLAEVGVDDQEEDILEVKFSGKKKSSKKKNSSAATAPEVESIDTSTDFAKPDDDAEDSKTTKTSEDVADTSKNKKKKKKGGKAGQEDDDLDKILAELGGAPTVSNDAAPVVPPPVKKVQNQPEMEEAAGDKEAEEEGPVESVASKKKKKKKEKEKEKKAAAAAPAVEEKQEEIKSETNNKAPGKKVPKHVREMQEKLARLKEAEEKKKREEEEKLRKEEEERRRQEELERLAEEKKRLKKEREKEKLLKKKQEGKLLTGKQKEEARRLEAMRKQILANAAALQLPTGESTGAPAKRPLYQKKKSKPQAQSNGAATSDNVESTSSKEIQQEIASELDSVEAKNVEEVESSSKSAFADEEADSEPEPLLKKEGKNARTATQDVVLPSVATKPAGSTEKAAPVMPLTSENVEVRKKSSEVEGADNKNNKVDRLYGWKTCRNAPITKAMKQQSKDVQIEFNMRLTQVITQFKEQGLNTELYYKNKEMGETFSIVPTSAISGEGIPDLLLLLVQWTQKTMVKRLTYSDEVQCTVLEVKVIEGHGTTIDVVLVNGVLHEGDQIVVCGLQGPIVTTIRALLTPHPMKELRVKGAYLHHKEIKAAQGIKITAQGYFLLQTSTTDAQFGIMALAVTFLLTGNSLCTTAVKFTAWVGLEHAIAGTSLYVVGPHDDLEDIKEAAMEDMKSVMSRIDKSGEGVYVQASTLGSLEALLEFLKSPAVTIPVSGISIGPVHKKDVMKASVMLEKKKEYGTILAFDVKVTPEARELADELGVKIFIADIIYHLFDQFKAYIDNLKEEKKKEAADEAVFPCVLKIIPNCVFNKKDPIVLGVDILEGIAK
ncbi:UNVERIFIED_CONTAM: Eukaryotic translation initiation factor 5B, partial [Sesamum radiatum]